MEMNELDQLQAQVNDQMPQAGSEAQMLDQMKTEMGKINPQQKQEAAQALMEIQKIIEQMIAAGATEEEIQAFLAEMGISIEELELAEQMLGL
jgi:hypothetical protein|tara:strand:- start:423 stop:701 length:279 start_codon:yes stop_codon:yes gene_type:complete